MPFCVSDREQNFLPLGLGLDTARDFGDVLFDIDLELLYLEAEFSNVVLQLGGALLIRFGGALPNKFSPTLETKSRNPMVLPFPMGRQARRLRRHESIPKLAGKNGVSWKRSTGPPTELVSRGG